MTALVDVNSYERIKTDIKLFVEQTKPYYLSDRETATAIDFFTRILNELNNNYLADSKSATERYFHRLMLVTDIAIRFRFHEIKSVGFKYFHAMLKLFERHKAQISTEGKLKIAASILILIDYYTNPEVNYLFGECLTLQQYKEFIHCYNQCFEDSDQNTLSQQISKIIERYQFIVDSQEIARINFLTLNIQEVTDRLSNLGKLFQNIDHLQQRKNTSEHMMIATTIPTASPKQPLLLNTNLEKRSRKAHKISVDHPQKQEEALACNVM